MNYFNKEVVRGFVRHGASAVGPLLVALGLFTVDEWGTLVGLVDEVIGVGITVWAFVDSYLNKKKVAATIPAD